jgi:hypothetical protein
MGSMKRMWWELSDEWWYMGIQLAALVAFGFWIL